MLWCIFFLKFCLVRDVIYSRNGSRVPLGVVPRLPLRSDVGTTGSADGFRGVLMPDGVELPLTFRLFWNKIQVSIRICFRYHIFYINCQNIKPGRL